MNLSSGIDLVEVERIERSIKSGHFCSRVFSEEERAMFAARGGSVQTMAAAFAAKEAFGKALGTGVRGFALNEVSLLRDGMGKPYFSFTGRAREIVLKKGLELSVSVTHTKCYAAVMVICQWEE